MKGMQGLAVAAILGLLAVVLNWLYLDAKTRGVSSISFIGVKRGITVQPGDLLREDHLVEVKIPSVHAGDLKELVYLWRELATVAGHVKATRAYTGGELIYRKDYRTPPPELKLAQEERLIWIPVDSKAFVPSLVDPGDEITFYLPAVGGGTSEMIGPFRVGSLGNRVGSSEVYKAHHIAPVQERQVGIIVKTEGNQLEAKAMSLLEKVAQRDGRNIWVSYHKRSMP